MVLVVISQVYATAQSLRIRLSGFSDVGLELLLVAVCAGATPLVRLKKKGRRELTRNGMGGIGNLLMDEDAMQIMDRKREIILATQQANKGNLEWGLTKLRQLTAEGCGLYTDEVLARLPHGCPLLEHLDVSSCPQITDDGLRSVIDGCRSFL